MILECPACEAKFKVADTAIPPEGRLVRCSRCTHEWRADPKDLVTRKIQEPVFVAPVIPKPIVEDKPVVDVTEPVADGEPPTSELDDDIIQRLESVIAAEPAAPRQNPTFARRHTDARPWVNPAMLKKVVPALSAVWMIAAFFAYSPSWSTAPVLSGIYRAFGATDTQGLVFSDVSMEREQEGSKAKFILAGSIRNYANEPRMVPTVRVILKDKSDKAIWGREYPVNHELKAGEVYPFRITNVETSFASSVSSIVVDMGNALQLLVR